MTWQVGRDMTWEAGRDMKWGADMRWEAGRDEVGSGKGLPVEENCRVYAAQQSYRR